MIRTAFTLVALIVAGQAMAADPLADQREWPVSPYLACHEFCRVHGSVATSFESDGATNMCACSDGRAIAHAEDFVTPPPRPDVCSADGVHWFPARENDLCYAADMPENEAGAAGIVPIDCPPRHSLLVQNAPNAMCILDRRVP